VLGRRGRNRFVAAATLRGFGWMVVLLGASALLLSGAPSLAALAYRTLGIALGAWSIRWLARQDSERLRILLARLAPWALLPYLALLLAVSGLLSTHWRSPRDAIDGIYVLGLIPLFDYYIVTKAEAAKNIVTHALLYAPVGVFVWLRGRDTGQALGWALLLGLTVETARYLRPGLEGDINAVAVAGLSAFAVANLMPRIWWMLESVAMPKASILPDAALGWRERAAATQLREAAHRAAPDKAEHF